MSRLDAAQLEAMLREILPVRSELHELALAGVAEAPSGDLNVTLQLIEWATAPDGSKQIRDVKEQDGRGVPEAYRDEPERVKAAALGWAAALQQVLIDLPEDSYCLPFELWCLPLELRRAQTAEDFQRACLARSRLGKRLKTS